MKKRALVINFLLMLRFSLLAEQHNYKPVNQPGEDKTIVRGKDGIHYWQTYMIDYQDSIDESIEKFKDLEYGIRVRCACNFFGNQLYPSGEMDLETYRTIGEAYKYVKKIEAFGPSRTPV